MSKVEKIYDVIIVGAGPAGLSAAKILAANNKKVLVLEKNKIVGKKVCAGGLTLKDFEELHLSKSLIEEQFKYINLYIYNRLIKLELDEPWIWTCSRRKLANWLLIEAKKVGTKVQLNSTVKKINDNSVITDNGKIYFFKYLIGADGSNSIVRKFLGLKTKRILIAMQYLVSRKEFNELEIFFDLKKFGPGYAWIFPHKDYASVGVGADPRFIKGDKLKNNFDSLCRKLNFNPSLYKLQAAPINYDYQGVEFNNIFLIGDAAGLTSGLTGEGMHPAMVSGREVAYKIINPKYNFKELKKIIKIKKIEEKVLDLYDKDKKITEIIFNFSGLLLKLKTVRKKLIKFLTEE